MGSRRSCGPSDATPGLFDSLGQAMSLSFFAVVRPTGRILRCGKILSDVKESFPVAPSTPSQNGPGDRHKKFWRRGYRGKNILRMEQKVLPPAGYEALQRSESHNFQRFSTINRNQAGKNHLLHRSRLSGWVREGDFGLQSLPPAISFPPPAAGFSFNQIEYLPIDHQRRTNQ